MTKRDKAALKLKLAQDVLWYVKANPRSTTRDIFNALLKKNPYYAIFIYTEKIGHAIKMVDLGRIEAAKTREIADKVLVAGIHPMTFWRRMRRSLMADVKQILTKEGHIILGSGMFGQICIEDVKPQDAAMWLAPRLSQIRHESKQWQKCIDVLWYGATVNTRNAVSELRNWSINIRNQSFTNRVHDSMDLFFRRP